MTPTTKIKKDKDLGVTDSGATSNEFNRTPTRHITAGTTGGSTITSSHKRDILVNYIPKEVITAHILPGLLRH